MATNSAPISSDSGLSQLVTGSPTAFPTGTRPAAIAPTTVPRKNGVSSDETPKRRSAICPAPQSPRRVVEGEARAAQDDAEGRQAQRDEQGREDRFEGEREPGPEHHEHEDQPDVVGLPDRADRPVDQRARPPAPAVAAGDEAPEAGPEVGPAEHGIRRHADPQHPGDGVGAAHRAPSSGTSAGAPADGPYGLAGVVLARLAPAARHRAQGDHERRSQGGVERQHEREGHPHAAGLRDRVLGPHHVVDDPWLAADLGHDPAALERDDRRHARHGDGAQEPGRLRDVAPAPPDEGEPEPRARSARCRCRPSCRRPSAASCCRAGGHRAARSRARSPACSCSSPRGTSRSPGSRSRPSRRSTCSGRRCTP